MVEIELEKTYLAKRLPEGLKSLPHMEIIDIYIPADEAHPCLRIRKRGDRFEITKKVPVNGIDASAQTEHTIKLTETEFNALSTVKGKKARKIRYEYVHEGNKGEIDVFQDDLAGLVLVDFEFTDESKKEAFGKPEFCLIDVTQDKAFAGGMLCGKRYSDIEGRLNELGYKKL